MQYLGVDLGYRTVVSGIATQGRRGSKEFVQEYYLEYSTDNKTWSVYTSQFGIASVSTALEQQLNQ